VVIPAAAYQAVVVARGLLEVRRSTIIPGRQYRLYQVLSTADWVLVSLAATGTVTLIWLAVRHLRGRAVSVLMEDEAG
jgi:allantoicase